MVIAGMSIVGYTWVSITLKMKIGIDARLYGTEHTGLGRYVTKLVDNL